MVDQPKQGRGEPSGGPPKTTARRWGAVPNFLAAQQAQRRYLIRLSDAQELGISEAAFRQALWRLQHQHHVAPVGQRRGLWVIVPPEWRTMGAPPIEWYLDDIMAALQQPYYVGLRSAAAYFGATHYALQVHQVLVPEPLAMMTIGRTRIRFVRSPGVEAVPTITQLSQGASVRVSTAEATALDLLRHVKQAGGLTMVVTTLAQMQAQLTPLGMHDALERMAHVAAAQRLGFCLALVGATKVARVIEYWLQDQPARRISLDTAASGGTFHEQWKLDVLHVPAIDL